MLLPALIATACAEGPASPGAPAVVELATGDAQQGLTGESLLRPIVVRITASDGRPLSGITPDVDVTSGTAAAEASGATGHAAIRWTLGPHPGEQILTAAVPGGSAATVRAEAVMPWLSDVVLLPEGVIDAGGAVLVSKVRNRMTAVWSGPFRDGRVILPPLKESDRELVVFPRGVPPLIAGGGWTPGPDTVQVSRRAPVRLDVLVTLHEPPLNALRATAEAHLRALRDIFMTAGIDLGVVEFRESPAPGTNLAPETFCAGAPAQRILIHYVATVGGSPQAGWACQNRIAMAARTGAFPGLLAHEVGHLLGLSHTNDPENVMNPSAPGSGLRDGQVFIAHFASYSVLNTILGATPQALTRNCRSTDILAGGCFEESFQLPF